MARRKPKRKPNLKKKPEKPNKIDLKKDPEAKEEGSRTEKETDKVNIANNIAEEAEAMFLEAHLAWRNLVAGGIGPGDFEEYVKQFSTGYKDVPFPPGTQVEEELKEHYYGEPKEEAPSVIKLSSHNKITPDVTEIESAQKTDKTDKTNNTKK